MYNPYNTVKNEKPIIKFFQMKVLWFFMIFCILCQFYAFAPKFKNSMIFYDLMPSGTPAH